MYNMPMPTLKLCPLGTSFRRKFQLVENYTLYVPSMAASLFAPAGFITEGASVPRMFSWLINPTGVLFIASLFHDIGYTYGGLAFADPNDPSVAYFAYMSKKDIDSLLRKVHGVSGWLAWASVSLFGWIAWRKHRKNNRKMIADFPNVVPE